MADNFKHTEAYVRKYGEQVLQEMRNRLVSDGKVASGKLFDSLRYDVKKSPDIAITFKVIGKAKEYAAYVDKGISGAGIPNGFKGKRKAMARSKFYHFKDTMPPEKSIKSWMRIQGIPKEASFPIRRSIFIFGIQPTYFFTISTTRRQKQFNEQVEKAMVKDIEEQLAKELKKRGR